MSRVAVVIPTWNGRELLDGALASLSRQSLSPDVVVVDNGSTDGTAEHVRTAHRRHGSGKAGIQGPSLRTSRHERGTRGSRIAVRTPRRDMATAAA